MTSSAAPFRPSDFQLPLPTDQLIRAEAPGEDALAMDVLIVGGGPAGLACAIRLKQLNPDLEVGVLEKAADLGGHCLSGAVINPVALQQLFPDRAISQLPLRNAVEADSVYLMTPNGQIRIPTPPTMHNTGNYVASICEVVQWMGKEAEALGVNLFPGYPADALLVDGDTVIGARTTPTGLDRRGVPGSNYSPPTDVSARVTVLAEGTRGPLSQAWINWQAAEGPNPQIYALGVKEIWEVDHVPTGVIHTLGWPLPRDVFGGSFLYPMSDHMVAFGLVVGLDGRPADVDVHALLQRLKAHPLFDQYLHHGKLVEWGAKTIPEGGYYSIPKRLHGHGLLLVGDAAGLVNVPSLKGIHYAMQSGIYAAETIAAGLANDDATARALHHYDHRIRESYITEDLWRTRNMRLAFKQGFLMGGALSTMMILTNGRFPGWQFKVEPDAGDLRNPRIRSARPMPAGSLSKLDAVFHAGNATRDDVPPHVHAGPAIPPEVADFYAAICPAGVYERHADSLVINAPNCVDCKATDVVGPRWSPREGGSGPQYKRM
ncbi:MAG: electron-transfer flavoprotein:ubiquinone oxidoreductase [bacterium]